MERLSKMSTSIRLFVAENIAQLPWPDTEDGAYARAYLTPLIAYGPQHFIENVTTTYMALLIDERIVLPLSLNRREYQNSYVCSPFTHYVTYAIEELALVQPAWLRRLFAAILTLLGLLGKACRMNQVLCVNNWLLSTNLYPPLTTQQLADILDFLQKRFPHHAIIFRSLNAVTTADILADLACLGCTPLGSRQVWLVQPADPHALNAKARWLLKRDLALISRHGYTLVTNDTLSAEDTTRIVELYNMLYLEKYSHSNPMFNERFIRLALHERTLQLIALKKKERIDAVLGYFCRNGIMTTPLFGYDTALPQELGLYRMLSAVLFQVARERGLLLHESSGAAQFKRNRGAYGTIEYSAIYHRHLPRRRRLYWSLLAFLLNTIGVPYMQRHRL
jgi:hypothetical protein